jgi:putative tryptophan/tyrosine transport system substrate-binding protein
LRQLGWIPGSNVLIEYLYAEGSLERLNQMARDLAEREVDVIIARGTAAAVAARNVTNRIPIVLAVTPDPVRAGLVASLAQPGGNITGLAFQSQGPLEAKQLELLRDGLPGLRRVAVLNNVLGQEIAGDASGDAPLERAAAALDLQLVRFEVRTEADLPAALERIASAGVDALLVRADPQILVPHRAVILAFALEHRLPAIYP